MITGVAPGQHGVIFNGLLIRKPGEAPVVEPWRDKREMVHSRTLYDAAQEKGLTSAQVDWVAILNAPSITWEFPERPDPKGAIAQEAVKSGILTQADLEAFGALSERVHIARDLVADDARRLRSLRVEADSREQVGEVDARRSDANAHLSGARLRVRPLLNA